jgi:acetyl esterase/lipase
MKKGVSASRIVCCGDSAGGGLAIAMCLAIRDGAFGVPGPAGVIGISPWIDLSSSTPAFSFSGRTDFTPSNESSDPHLGVGRRTHYCPNDSLRNPYLIICNYCRYVSPLYARSLNDLPPMLIQVGEVERLREEAAIFAFRTVVTPFVGGIREGPSVVCLEIYQDQGMCFVY